MEIKCSGECWKLRYTKYLSEQCYLIFKIIYLVKAGFMRDAFGSQYM